MAYMNQEKKARIASKLKPVLAKYGLKGSLRVRNHSSIVLTLKSGKIDFIENYIETDAGLARLSMSEHMVESIRKAQALIINPYWYQDHFTGKAKQFLTEALVALKSADWYDESDAMTDYFNTAYYVDINVGQYDKPYTVTA